MLYSSIGQVIHTFTPICLCNQVVKFGTGQARLGR